MQNLTDEQIEAFARKECVKSGLYKNEEEIKEFVELIKHRLK